MDQNWIDGLDRYGLDRYELDGYGSDEYEYGLEVVEEDDVDGYVFDSILMPTRMV